MIENTYKKLPFHFLKYTGSKRNLAPEIIRYIPENDYLIEPFCGTCSISLTFLYNGLKSKKIICSDKNTDLINLLLLCKNNPSQIAIEYERYWNELNELKSIPEKIYFYNLKRDEYNKTRNPNILLFLLRTCYNGLVRYNSKGDFNSAFHITRSGINPNKLKAQIDFVSSLLKNIEIKNEDYLSFTDEKAFFILDPPYEKSKELYLGCFDQFKFKDFLKEKRFVMTFDDGSSSHDFKFVDLSKAKSGFMKLRGLSYEVKERMFYNLDD